MSQADELLNSLSDEGTNAGETVEGHIVINSDRSITVPESLKNIANQFDHNVETVTFDCPRYWDGRDLSTMAIYINYQLSDGSVGCYPVPEDNVTVDDTDDAIMHFDWTISRNVTLLIGKVAFIISARETDENGRLTTCWNTDICEDVYISEGIDPVDEIRKYYPDIITYLRTQLMDYKINDAVTKLEAETKETIEELKKELEAETDEAVQSSKDEYLQFVNDLGISQTIGDGETVVMSQKTISDMLTINPLEGKPWGYYSFYYPEDGSVGYKVATWKNRIGIPEIHHYPYDVYISVKEDYKFNVAYLTSSIPSFDTFIEGTSWRTEALTVKAGTYFSLTFARANNTELALEEVENLSVKGCFSAKDVYGLSDIDIVSRNKDIEHIVQACCNYGRDGDKYKKCLSMLVSTDIHGDSNSLENMINYLNNTGAIDCGICLGDIQTMTYGDNDGTWYTDVVNQSIKNFYTVLGNHDIGVWNGYEGNGTAKLAFDKFIKPTLGKIGISDLTTPYYAITFDSYKTVVVVLNTYDVPDNTDTNGEFIISRNNEAFSQEQIDWLVQTLASVPSSYHVVVAMHSVGFPHLIIDGNFTHKNDTYALEMRYPYGTCTILPDIINAWKNGTTFTGSYAPIEYTDILTTLTVDCNFTARGTGDFVCYLVGHDHTDKIMKCAKYEDQIIVSLVTSASSDYHVEHSDLPRIKGTKTEDALTVFSVDPDHRLIKLVRVGSNITNELVDRTFIAIPY